MQMLRISTAVVILLSAVCSYGQTPDTAALRGVVSGPGGRVLADAQVVIQDAQHHALRTLVTNRNGRFAAEGLPSEQPLNLRASYRGLQTATTGAVILTAGSMGNVRFRLEIPTVSGQVIVTGAAGEVRTDEPQLGERLTAQQIQATPLLNRRITYLPLLNAANRPAINQGDVFMNQNLFTSNGTGRRQTWFEVDGANGDDMWGRQTIFTNIPQDGVAGMTVLENAFAADYGFGEGAVVNIITRSGGDHLHGAVEGMWRPSATEAKLAGFSGATAASGNDITRDTLAQGAASLGGPLGDQTFLFGAGEYSYEDRASPVISPLDPENYIGHYRGWMGFMRADHTFGEAQHAFLRLNADGFLDTNPNGIVGGNTLPDVARVFRRRTYSTEAGSTSVLSSTMVNEARLQFQLASPITQFSPVVSGTQYSVPISSGGTFTSGTSQSALLINRQYEIEDTVEKTLRKSELRAGFDLIHARNGGNSKEFGGPIYLGQLVYKSCTGAAAYCESPAYLGDITNVQSYTQSYGNANYAVDDTLLGAFGQWDFHPIDDLALNAGLRYELQTFTDARKDFAPRVGFAYTLGRQAVTLRGGFGIYYSQIVDNSEANYALTGPTGVFNYTAQAGQAGFPSSVSAVPLPAFPPGAAPPIRSLFLRPGRPSYYNQYFPTSDLLGYPQALTNPYNEQWTLGIERQLATNWVLASDYIGSHTLGIQRPLDLDPPTSFLRTGPGEVRTAQAANCTRPYWVDWYARKGVACDPIKNAGATPPYSVILSDVNGGMGWYDAVDVKLSHEARNGSALLASYTWSHTLDTVDPDTPSQNPNDPRMTGQAEKANAIFDQRNRFVLSGMYTARWGLQMGGIATIATGLPYNFTTGVNNSGDTGATTDRPFVNGAIVGRNTGRGSPIYDLDPFISKRISIIPERLFADIRVETFNLLNHRNYVGFSGTWGNGPSPGHGFGQPLAGVTNQLYPRELQFSARIEY